MTHPFWHLGLSISVVVIAVTLTTSRPKSAQPARHHYPLENSAGLRLHNVEAEPAVLAGKKGLRITLSDETLRRFGAMTDQEIDDAQAREGQYAAVEGLELSDGVITAEIAGAVPPGARPQSRAFVGIAFRLENDAYDVFTLRMTNGRAEVQERRNHSTQYASHPDWPWFRMRSAFPERYESYVDLMPDTWIRVRVEIKGRRARLFVHNHKQPTLIVNDLMSGHRSGQVALWVNYGTVAHFRDLTVIPDRGVTTPATPPRADNKVF